MNGAFKDNETVIEGKELKPCLMCKKPTRYIEVCSEAHFCCQECLDKFYGNYNKWFDEKIGEDIEL